MSRKTPPSPAGTPGIDGNQWAILKDLLPFLWPEGRTDLKARVVIAMVALVVSKVITVATPYSFKYATDALTSGGSAAAIAVSVPLFLVLAYGVGRIMMVVLAQFRDAIFAKVGQRAVRELSIRTFRHLHALSLKFHLERRTGGLSRIVSRGTAGIDTVLRFSLFNTFPTVLEIALVAGVLTWSFGWPYAAVVLATVVFYIWFTYAATEWRIAIRRAMNEADTDANTKAIDSLLNFETVKYFGNEDHETARYDVSMAKYEKAAVKTWVSLAVLNSGQAFVFAIGLTIVMAMSALAIARGQATRGRLRADQRPDGAALYAAQFHRLVLPRDQAGTDRRRADVQSAEGERRNRRPPRRPPARSRQGGSGLRGGEFRLRQGAPDHP